MTILSPSFKGQAVIEGAKNVNIINLVHVDTSEHSVILTANLKQIIIKSRDNANLQIAFVLGESTTKYMTIPKGAVLELNGSDFTGKTLFISANKASTTELLELY